MRPCLRLTLNVLLACGVWLAARALGWGCYTADVLAWAALLGLSTVGLWW